MAAWGRMGGGQRPRPCGYLTDCLPAHLPPLHPHGEGSSAETPCYFPAPPRLDLPARSSQAFANGRQSPSPSSLRAALCRPGPELQPVRLGSSIRRTQSRRARSGRPSVCFSRHYCSPAVLFVDTGVRKSANVNSSGGASAEGGCKQGEAKAAIWGISRGSSMGR